MDGGNKKNFKTVTLPPPLPKKRKDLPLVCHVLSKENIHGEPSTYEQAAIIKIKTYSN